MRAAADDVEERNYAKSPLSRDEILELVELAGSVAAVLSTRNAGAKERGWQTTVPDRETFATAAAADNNLLRRPILVVGKSVVVGKDAPAIRAALAR